MYGDDQVSYQKRGKEKTQKREMLITSSRAEYVRQ